MIDADGFAAWLETRPYSPITRALRVKQVRACYRAGVTSPDDVDEVFIHRSASRKYRTNLRSALRLYADYTEAVV